jgi:hypothetical protein
VLGTFGSPPPNLVATTAFAPPEFRGRGHEILGAATGGPQISPPVFTPVFAVHSVYFARNCAVGLLARETGYRKVLRPAGERSGNAYRVAIKNAGKAMMSYNLNIEDWR